MIELRVTRWRVLLDRLYWRPDVEVEPGIYEATPRRFASILRPLMGFPPCDGTACETSGCYE